MCIHNLYLPSICVCVCVCVYQCIQVCTKDFFFTLLPTRVELLIWFPMCSIGIICRNVCNFNGSSHVAIMTTDEKYSY